MGGLSANYQNSGKPEKYMSVRSLVRFDTHARVLSISDERWFFNRHLTKRKTQRPTKNSVILICVEILSIGAHSCLWRTLKDGGAEETFASRPHHLQGSERSRMGTGARNTSFQRLLISSMSYGQCLKKIHGILYLISFDYAVWPESVFLDMVVQFPLSMLCPLQCVG